MNSALEVLFSTPELARRYGTPPEQPLMNHTIFQGVSMTAAPSNLLVQTAKVASALTSGVFCRPLDADETDPKYRLAPRLFKHCIGKDHVDFRTTQQQDAAQFWQYLLQQLIAPNGVRPSIRFWERISFHPHDRVACGITALCVCLSISMGVSGRSTNQVQDQCTGNDLECPDPHGEGHHYLS